MDLSFDSKATRTLCENSKRAATLLGEELAKELQARLADLEAADQLSDFLRLMGLIDVTTPGDILVPLTTNASIVVTPYLRATGTGSAISVIDSEDITRVTIRGVTFADG